MNQYHDEDITMTFVKSEESILSPSSWSTESRRFISSLNSEFKRLFDHLWYSLCIRIFILWVFRSLSLAPLLISKSPFSMLTTRKEKSIFWMYPPIYCMFLYVLNYSFLDLLIRWLISITIWWLRVWLQQTLLFNLFTSQVHQMCPIMVSFSISSLIRSWTISL